MSQALCEPCDSRGREPARGRTGFRPPLREYEPQENTIRRLYNSLTMSTRALIASLLFVSTSLGAVPTHPVQKRLIEFGWDEPDTAFMKKHIGEMEKTPFDGCVFHAYT